MKQVRRYIQTISAFILNAYWYFPVTRNIYQGRLKYLCSPGLNCYSCPAATSACPIGAIQNLFATVRPSLEAARYHVGFYVIGWLGMIGGLVGRMPCGWLCPFGLIQDLLFRVPTPKIRLPKLVTYGPYFFLGLTVILLPILIVDSFGYGSPWFCKLICPAGTLEAGLPLLAMQPALREMIRHIFYIKVLVLLFFVVFGIVSSRFFCRTSCPLGAIYSFFNRVSLFQLKFYPEKCKGCDACYRDCPMDIKVYESPNDSRCIRCLVCVQKSCKFEALGYEIGSAREKVLQKA